jgi:hypothetical protein
MPPDEGLRPALAAAALVCTLGGCVHSGLVVPAQGGTPWRELTSPHFRLRTDWSEQPAREFLLGFEQSYVALEALLEFTFSNRPGPAGKIDVIAFERREDFHDITTADEKIGGFQREREGGEQQIIFGGPPQEGLIPHELVHRFVRHYIVNAPPWLHEGLAQYYGSLKLAGGYATFGRPAQAGAIPSIEDLLHADAYKFHDPDWLRAYYRGAVVLVHMLNSADSTDRTRFLRYVALLGQGVPAGQAWQDAFPDYSPATWNDRLHEYAKEHVLRSWRTKLEPQPSHVTSVRTLRDYETRLLWIDVAGPRPDLRDWTQKQLTEARREQPGDSEVLYYAARYEERWGSLTEARRLLRQAAGANPDAPRYWLSLGRLELREMAGKRQPAPAEDPESVARLKQLASSADALEFLARYMAATRRPNEGLPFAMRALDSSPGCWTCLDALAVLLAEKGALLQAAERERLAVNLVPDYARHTREAFLKRLAQYERAAAQKQP